MAVNDALTVGPTATLADARNQVLDYTVVQDDGSFDMTLVYNGLGTTYVSVLWKVGSDAGDTITLTGGTNVSIHQVYENGALKDADALSLVDGDELNIILAVDGASTGYTLSEELTLTLS